MIVNDGKLALLGYQLDALELCEWRLFTDNETITSATVLSDLTEAAWTGYMAVVVGTLNSPAIVGGRASTTPASAPVFTNGSGSGVTFYGWMLVDTSLSKLIAATNLGATTIPAGQSVALTPTITDTQE